MQRVITRNDLSSASCFTGGGTYWTEHLQRQKENMEQGRQVVLCLFNLFYFIHSFFFSILIKFYHVLNFAFLSEWNYLLVDCQSVNRSDVKAGSGPEVASVSTQRWKDSYGCDIRDQLYLIYGYCHMCHAAENSPDVCPCLLFVVEEQTILAYRSQLAWQDCWGPVISKCVEGLHCLPPQISVHVL